MNFFVLKPVISGTLVFAILSLARLCPIAGGEDHLPMSGYKVVFSDDFDQLDVNKTSAGLHTWYEGVWFNPKHAPLTNIVNNPSAASLIWSRNQTSPDTSITTFSGSRKHSLTWRYGYFEARMKWDVVPGAWPAFWLLPVEDAGNETVNAQGVRESCEIDVFEGQGGQPHTFFGTIHDWTNLRDAANRNNHFPLDPHVDLSQYHTYGLLWEPGTVTWYFDNRALHSEPAPAVCEHENFFLVMTMQAGTNWKLNDLTEVTASSMSLTVDWVRVWKK